ncbi:MAG: type II toxin-antitoxin system HicA family toxin [Parcubacteria group bacterium]|nr:type II toxin-antitoxin system HicA family toxin [Parcubacteria group bacterium]
MAPVHWRELVHVFVRDGFTHIRTRGDHLVYDKTGTKRSLIIPMYRQVPVYIIEGLLKTAGMSRERYFELLNS